MMSRESDAKILAFLLLSPRTKPSKNANYISTSTSFIITKLKISKKNFEVGEFSSYPPKPLYSTKTLMNPKKIVNF